MAVGRSPAAVLAALHMGRPLLHLYAHLGVGLALPHQLWSGQEFLQSPAATVYWWTLWAAAAGAILVWRILLPLWRSARYRLRVAGVVRESSERADLRDRASIRPAAATGGAVHRHPASEPTGMDPRQPVLGGGATRLVTPALWSCWPTVLQ
jgi:hypothetical protein